MVKSWSDLSGRANPVQRVRHRVEGNAGRAAYRPVGIRDVLPHLQTSARAVGYARRARCSIGQVATSSEVAAISHAVCTAHPTVSSVELPDRPLCCTKINYLDTVGVWGWSLLPRLPQNAALYLRSVFACSAQYNSDMSESIESRDSIWILQHALGHLKAQGKNVSNDDDVFELQMHAINVFRGMSLTTRP